MCYRWLLLLAPRARARARVFLARKKWLVTLPAELLPRDCGVFRSLGCLHSVHDLTSHCLTSHPLCAHGAGRRPMQGKFWDQRTREWVEYDPAEQIQLEGADAAAATGGGGAGGSSSNGAGAAVAGGSGRKPKSDEFYTILGLKHDATPAQVWRVPHISIVSFVPLACALIQKRRDTEYVRTCNVLFIWRTPLRTITVREPD